MFLLKGLLSFAYCQATEDHLNYIRSRMNEQINRMKHELGTQIMSYPNITYGIKGDRYSLSFPIDNRKGTLGNVIKHLENEVDAKIRNKEKTRIRGMDCIRYDFGSPNDEFTVTLIGPTNNYFYLFEYVKKEGFNKDFERLSQIYQKANKQMDPKISRKLESGGTSVKPSSQDPYQVLESLGVKVYQPQESYLEWDYLAGCEQAKTEIEDTIMLTLERPDIFDKITEVTRVKNERNRPRAVLFEGPPGTGKTTSAKIISHKVNIPMVYIRLENFVSQWYGQTEKTLAQIFESCTQIGKCVVFIDEVDSLATSRETNMHEATRRLLSVFLRYLDGFESSDEVIVICATNRKQDLDPALQSRFSKVIEFPFPDLQSRVAIFKRYAKHLNEEQLKILGGLTEGMSGRDIKNVCEDAERHWAARVLRGEVENYEVNFDLYLNTLKSKSSTV